MSLTRLRGCAPRSRRTLCVGVISVVFLLCCVSPAAAQPGTARGKVDISQQGKIFGDDDREIITETSQAPWSSVGFVHAAFDEEADLGTTHGGSGVLIGPRTVVTAAHVVYHPEYGWADSISFAPGKN